MKFERLQPMCLCYEARSEAPTVATSSSSSLSFVPAYRAVDAPCLVCVCGAINGVVERAGKKRVFIAAVRRRPTGRCGIIVSAVAPHPGTRINARA